MNLNDVKKAMYQEADKVNQKIQYANEVLIPFEDPESYNLFGKISYYFSVYVLSKETPAMCDKCHIPMQKVCDVGSDGKIYRRFREWGMSAEVGMHTEVWQKCPNCGNMRELS